MVAMLVPGWDGLGPLGWAGLLGGVAYWAAGAAGPVRARLPVLCDLVATAVLAVVMPLEGAHAVAVPGHVHGGVGGGVSPRVVVVVWVVVRCWIAWSGRRSRRAVELGRVGEMPSWRVVDLGEVRRRLAKEPVLGPAALSRWAADLGRRVREPKVAAAVGAEVAMVAGMVLMVW